MGSEIRTFATTAARSLTSSDYLDVFSLLRKTTPDIHLQSGTPRILIFFVVSSSSFSSVLFREGKMGKYNHQVTVSGLPFGSAFTLTVPGDARGDGGGVGARGGVDGRGGRGGGRGGRGGGRGGRGGRVSKPAKMYSSRERGHIAVDCPYSKDEAIVKRDAADEKKKSPSSTSAASTSTTYHVAPFAGWKPGFVMPPPPRVDAEGNMIVH
ncbi:hypothetical protein Fcan01_19371 [Folsomia candida]|uniref:Uncharacterized protein n=1 Tax=Folsomia candida TaxID=158441 RepID=A0A226DPQ4_FOLCA|nr:hypothetical protein Fcan01_19371 [Folsomia candida]